MRGKRGENRGKGLASGLIPTHAGKTERMRWTSGNRRAHPRSCGENRTRGVPGGYFTGSSPLTRGKPVRRCSPIHKGGLIPAHAGKTRWRYPARSCPRAHLRSRGENLEDARTDHLHDGSSPLTRGKPASSSSPVGALGLIPTHAGKTGFRSYVRSSRPTHPRSCGENVVCFCAPSAVQGSSPLTRENMASSLAFAWSLGSSPLTRGKRGPVRGDAGKDGLIPAHAGKTSMALQRSPRSPAHPRSRGENQMGPGP